MFVWATQNNKPPLDAEYFVYQQRIMEESDRETNFTFTAALAKFDELKLTCDKVWLVVRELQVRDPLPMGLRRDGCLRHFWRFW